jgi:catechol 2,3-dioxygenase-like lactoylglutathione lyase family enzyme
MDVTTTAADRDMGKTVPWCGCCGRTIRADRLVELGNTPGVFICDQCALWAARRSTRMPVIPLDPRPVLRWLRSRLQPPQPLARAIPVLPSTDLDRTCAFYQAYGLEQVARDEGYLLLRIAGMEVHFSLHESPVVGEAFVLVPNASQLWKQLRSRDATGLGPLEDRPHGLREFVVTDPDGNQIRVGSPTPD